MHVLKVQLFNYRFNSFHELGPRNFTCFKLSEQDEEIEGVCMTHEELTSLTNYIASNKVNFGYSSYHNCDPEFCPEMDEYDLMPIKALHPDYIIIRKQNILPLNKTGDIVRWMDIELLEENGIRKGLTTLPFGLVCQLDKF